MTNGTEIDERRVDRPAMILARVVVYLDDRTGTTSGCGGAVLKFRWRGSISEAYPDKHRMREAQRRPVLDRRDLRAVWPASAVAGIITIAARREVLFTSAYIADPRHHG